MTDILLYNTRTRTKEPFEPIDPKNVRMYVCGPTVYDRAHIGNARPVVVFDVFYRLLRHVYGEAAVTYARNFTDVDDRIINRAVETKGDSETLEAACRRITDETIAWYHEDMDALGALRPNQEPRCTEYIPQMVTMTEKLIAEGHAYEAEGHVLFAVETYDRYGKLAGRSLDDMLAGSRVEVAPYKKNPMDFVLWKPSTPEQPGWESPWGRGRPGWHIECSAMAQALLGDVFDIHGGGIDLQFPHHENEVAQSCCANHTEVMANVWMHNGFLQVEGEKMAKSLGNFFTVKDLRDKGVPGEAMRMILMSANYRQPLDWTDERLKEIEIRLSNWARLKRSCIQQGFLDVSTKDPCEPCPDLISALSDDLNFAEAMRRLNELAADARIADGGNTSAPKLFFDSLEFLGFKLENTSRAIAAVERATTVIEKIEEMISELGAARARKDWGAADPIKARLQEAGVQINISSAETTYELTPNFDASKLLEVDP